MEITRVSTLRFRTILIAVALAAAGESAAGPLYLLGAVLALTLSLAPLAIAAALRISLE